MSYSYVLHNSNSLKAPTQKIPSAFQVSWKSSKLPLSFMKLRAHSIFWSSQNHLIISRLRVPVLRYYSPSFLMKQIFVMPIAIHFQIPNLNETQFQTMAQL